MWTSLLQSRKSYSSSEENCPNSVWEAADFLHIHNPLLQVVCRTYDVSAMCYARGVCAACVQGRTWIFQFAAVWTELTDLGKFLQFCPDRLSKPQVGEEESFVCVKSLGSELTGAARGSAELCAHPPRGSSNTSEQRPVSKPDFTHASWRYAHSASSGTPGKLNTQ